MDWKEVLEKIRLADIQAKLETDQFGVINVKTENKTYNFHFHDADAVRAFMEGEKTPEIEKEVKEEAQQRLASIQSSLDFLSDESKQEVVVATTAQSSVDFFKIKKL